MPQQQHHIATLDPSFDYEHNAKGFQSCCRDIDARHWQEELRHYSEDVMPLASLMPCHAELHRCVIWSCVCVTCCCCVFISFFMFCSMTMHFISQTNIN